MGSFIDPRLQEGEERPLAPYPRPSDASDRPPYYPSPSYATTPQQHTPIHQNPETPQSHPVPDSRDRDQISPANQEDPKRPRACESCRGLKVRCDQDLNNPDGACKRCAKAKRQCIYTQPSRKRQKKADNRVADLERKLDALTAALHAQQQSPGVFQAPHADSPAQARMVATPHAQQHPRHPEPAAVYSESGPPVHAALPAFQNATDQGPPKKRQRTDGSSDVISESERVEKDHNRDSWDLLGKEQAERLARNGVRRELYPVAPEVIIKLVCDTLDRSTRERIFDRFVNDCLPTLPAVSFPKGTTAEEVLESKPILFLVIMGTAGWGHLPAEAQNILRRETLDIFAECIVRHAIKSLEIVQSLLVAVLWYRPPEKPEQLNFYMIVHMAACMALDIGLGKRFTPAKVRRGFGGPASDLPPGRLTMVVDSDSIEGRRTWLACYYVCGSVAMSLRRPYLIRWTDYMHECCEFLETSEDAEVSDRFFVKFVRLQKICEDIATSFQMDDPSATAVSISDPKVSYTLDVYEQKLKDWNDNLPADMRAKSHLLFLYEVAVLYLHEIAMHVNHNVDDFKLPFTEESLRSGAHHSEVLTQRQMAALEACLKSAHTIIATYAAFGFEVAGNLPTLLFFIRCAYALVVLIKMHMAVITPGSEVAKIIKIENVRVEEHMEMLWNLFHRMARYDGKRPHGKALKILSVLRDWFLKHKDGDNPPKAGQSGSQTASNGSQPFGRNPHGVTANSKLQVLSEAATYNGGSSSQSTSLLARDLAKSAANQAWTVDSPTVFNVHARDSQSNNASGPTSETTPSTLAGTPRMTFYDNGNGVPTSQVNMPIQNTMPSSYGQGFNNLFSPGGADNLDWMAGMDLDQVLDGAFRDIDASGDLGNWFFGDGVGAFQMPGDPPPNVGDGKENGQGERGW